MAKPWASISDVSTLEISVWSGIGTLRNDSSESLRVGRFEFDAVQAERIVRLIREDDRILVRTGSVICVERVVSWADSK